MPARLVGILLIIFLLGISTELLANTKGQHFDRGMQAFRAGDYAIATEEFEQARSLGMDVPALYYNLGVSYYRSADWDRSEEMFLQTSRFDEMAPLAFYNLGLVNLKKGNEEEARLWFSRAMDEANDSRLESLAQAQLDNLNQPDEKWASIVTAGLGYDSNVTLDNDTVTNVSSEQDYFLEFFGMTRGVLSGTSENGVIFKASLFGDIYKKLTDYNLIEANVGGYKTFSLGQWNHEAGGYMTYSTLGGEGYLQSGNLSWAGQTQIVEKLRLNMKLRLRYVTAVQSQYSALDGTAEDFRVEARWMQSSLSQLHGIYQLELNDRNGWETGSTFSSLSPTRNTFRLEYLHQLDESWNMVVSGSYRNSHYSEENLEADGEVVRRRDDRLRGYLEFSRTLSKHAGISLEYTYTNNQSNIDRYDYDQNIISANVQYLF